MASNKSLNKTYLKILMATWLGWLFDGLDSSIYPLVANQALSELIGGSSPEFELIAAKVAAIFLVGWALGGYIFGYLGDKIGRAKALSFSILTYALFSGLSGLSHSWQDLAFYRFLTGLGIGGEWALGVALLAEAVDPKKRIMSTAFLATGFPVGYFIAAMANFIISPFGWRWVFVFGIIPAILVFFIRREIKEPPLWQDVKEKIKSPLEIFQKSYRKNLVIAFLLGVTFSMGSWSCLIFWLPIWAERILGLSLNERTFVISVLMAAHVAGCYLAGPLLNSFSRRAVLFWSYFLCFIFASFLYTSFHVFGLGVLLIASLLGLSFGVIPSAFAIYFPELFPTRIRSTAKGFCYNTGRLLTALGVLYSGTLVQNFNGNIGYAAAVMSLIFLVGAIVSLFAPKTDKDKLPA